MFGKCPSCGQAVASVNVSEIAINAGGGKQFVGVAYLCPACQAILSVTIDQIALKVDTVNAVLSGLGH